MKIVLVVEDNDYDFVDIEAVLRDKVQVIRANTLERGRQLFCDHAVNAVIMDACLKGSTPDSMPLIREILKSGFKGPIISASSINHYNNILMEAGATHKGSKLSAPQIVLELLMV